MRACVVLIYQPLQGDSHRKFLTQFLDPIQSIFFWPSSGIMIASWTQAPTACLSACAVCPLSPSLSPHSPLTRGDSGADAEPGVLLVLEMSLWASLSP